MLTTTASRGLTRLHSDAARWRMERPEERPLFFSDWVRAVFIHFECDPELLQRLTPYRLDLRDGKAYVSLVAFTMVRLRPSFGGRFTEVLCKPIATHSFMNVRTYVRHGGTTGIFFLTEWLPNRLSVLLGPVVYGLPYRFGRLNYHNDMATGSLRGCVVAPPDQQLSYTCTIDPLTQLHPCASGSPDEFLLERYTAFLIRGTSKVLFHIWHEPWPQTQIKVDLPQTELLRAHCPWFPTARRVSANYSTGVENVWVGAPMAAGLS